MRAGQIVASLDAREATEETVMQHATGVYAEDAAPTETAGTAR